MKLIPHDKFIIETFSAPEDVLQRINENTEPKKLFSLSSSKYFNGSVSGSGFEVSKNISYRNSFLPVVEGNVETSEKGSNVKITMRLNSFVFFFMCIWFFFVGIGCVAVVSNLDGFSMHALIPFGMLVFGIVLVSGGFWFEASKQKVKLIELIKN